MSPSTSLLAPTRGVELFVLDDEGVLFCESTQELHRLNLPATWVWCALESGRDPDAVAEAFAAGFELEAEGARQRVAALVESWRERGWLRPRSEERTAGYRTADVVRRRRLPGRPASPSDCPSGRSRSTPSWPEARSYRLLSTDLSIRCAVAAIDARIRPVLAHLEVDDPGAQAVRLEIAGDQGGSGYVLFEEGLPVERCGGLDAVAPMVKSHLRQLAIGREDYLLQLHAAAVSDGEGCTLLPGSPGSGKSTLTAGLVARGSRYLTDEVALLDAHTFEVRALPLALTLKPGALAALAPDWPDVRGLRPHLREDGQIVRYLCPPPGAAAAGTASRQPVRAIVFPRYRAEAATVLRSIGRAEALARLLGECLSLPYRLDRSRVQGLVAWLRRVPCAELQMSALPEAIRLLRAYLDDAAREEAHPDARRAG